MKKIIILTTFLFCLFSTILYAQGHGPPSGGGTDVALADGGTGESLADPGADRILFWDDSEGTLTWLIPGTGLAISATTLNVSITSLDIGLLDGDILIGNASNLADNQTMSGDVTISNTGVMTIGTDKIDPAMISTDAVTPDAIDKDGAFTGLTGNWATTGTLSGGSLTPVTDNATEFAGNFTGGNLYGGTFVCDVAGTIQLPLMVAGMNFTVITLGAIAVVIDTNANDGYLMDGVTGTEGKNLTNLSTAGDIAVLQYYTADDWLITTNGWTAE